MCKITCSVTELIFFLKSYSSGWLTLNLNHLESSFSRGGGGVGAGWGGEPTWCQARGWHLSTPLALTEITLYNLVPEHDGCDISFTQAPCLYFSLTLSILSPFPLKSKGNPSPTPQDSRPHLFSSSIMLRVRTSPGSQCFPAHTQRKGTGFSHSHFLK